MVPIHTDFYCSASGLQPESPLWSGQRKGVTTLLAGKKTLQLWFTTKALFNLVA